MNWCRERASNPRTRLFRPVLYLLSYRDAFGGEHRVRTCAALAHRLRLSKPTPYRSGSSPVCLLVEMWRPVRDSNPRLPTRQVGTLTTELTRQMNK